MSPTRAVLLLRRLSAGDTKLKNIGVNQTGRDCHLTNCRDFSGIRITSQSTSSQPFAYNIPDHIIRMASTSTGAKEPQKHINRLKDSKSPYLLQHAHNPVDWYPWGPEAFEKAKQENKLIFLSVGYSTCHWCHVMEKESFENEEVAKIMNENFVNIKVDREERPDIDKVYMLFVQASSGGGGWPMSVFLTPDLLPVTGGTYFPPEDKWGRPGFKTILLSLSNKWKKNNKDFLETSQNILEVLKKAAAMEKCSETNKLPSTHLWEKAMNQYSRSYEPQFGGFGHAPKFPQPSNLNFLFHIYARNKKDESAKKCLDMCLHTLKKMANGGIHDHISSGFARYSVDSKWHVPHFEKMLYDQAQLTSSYTDAYLATKDPFYAEIVRDIIKYVNRDLSHELGGFYSAEDADSYPTSDAKSKCEGAFCVWEYGEIETLLDHKEINSIKYTDIFCHHFGVKPEGNCSRGSDPHGELTNKNVLIIYGSVDDTCSKFGLTREQLLPVLDECKSILYEERQKRPRPHLDDKILCSWNGLMISGLARAGQGLGEKAYVDRAVKAANFLRQYLYNEDTGILLRSCYQMEDGSVGQMSEPIHGFLDDYAFLIRGLIDLYEATLDSDWLKWAQTLQAKQNHLFWDEKDGGYFTSSADDGSVVLRLKEDQDGAEPCGNSVSCHNLLRFAAFSDKNESNGNERILAERILKAYSVRLEELPMALPEMLSAFMFYNDSPTQVLIAGGREDPRTLELVRVVRSRLLPGRVLAVTDPSSVTTQDIAVLSRIRPIGDRPTAYVCRRYACSLPVTEVRQLEELLDGESGVGSSNKA